MYARDEDSYPPSSIGIEWWYAFLCCWVDEDFYPPSSIGKHSLSLSSSAILMQCPWHNTLNALPQELNWINVWRISREEYRRDFHLLFLLTARDLWDAKLQVSLLFFCWDWQFLSCQAIRFPLTSFTDPWSLRYSSHLWNRSRMHLLCSYHFSCTWWAWRVTTFSLYWKLFGVMFHRETLLPHDQRPDYLSFF